MRVGGNHMVVWALLVVVGVGFVVPQAQASERRFTFSYEATTSPKGMWEYEQFVTWSTSKGNDSKFDRLDFRHEFEVGLTDHLQLGIYVADWRYQDGRSVENDRAEYRDTAFELIYNLTNPVADPVGLALYGEVKIGDELFELEGKFIVQKDIGPWTLVYNVIIEAEWEGDRYEEDKGEFAQTFGVSYQVRPQFLVGAELVHEVEFPDWNETDDHLVYLGPNASYRASKWWVTVTPLFQVTDEDSAADFVTRMILGFDF